MRITIKQNPKENTFNLTFEGMTKGKVQALKNAIASYAEKSVVCEDIHQAVKRSDIQQIINP